MDELKLKRVAAYCRVSTERQAEEQTIEVQKRFIQEWADKNNAIVVKWYCDDGWSGDLLQRPALDELLEDVGEELWEGVVFLDRDRVARNVAYQEFVFRELRDKSIELYCVTSPMADTDEGNALQQVLAVFAELDRKKIVRKMRQGKIHKAKSGKLVGHQAPYGYRYILKNQIQDGRFEIYEPEAEIVRMVFSWVAYQGYSIHRVVKELYAMKIPPSKKKSERWVKSSVARMLNREDYIGTSYYNRREAIVPKNPIRVEKYKRVKKSSRRVRPKDEWYPIPVPSIIDKELFDLAHKRMRENFLYGKRNKTYEYLLTGKVNCACGARRVGDGDKEHHYYRCAARIYNYPLETKKCENEGVNAEILDAMVWNKLLELLANPSVIKSQAEKWVVKQSKTVNKTQDELYRLESALEKLRDEEKRYVKAFGSKVIEFNQFEESMRDVKAKREAIELQIKDFVEKAPDDAVNLDSFESVCDTIYYSIKHSAASEKQEYLRNLIVSIYVEERRKAIVNGRIPVSVQAQNVGYESISRHNWSTKCRKVNAF
jgi:site-specific DNA recombinase